MADLIGQIKQEAQELRDAPIVNPIIGKVARCHLCGKIVDAYSLQAFDTHVPRGLTRMACPDCHPNRGI